VKPAGRGPGGLRGWRLGGLKSSGRPLYGAGVIHCQQSEHGRRSPGLAEFLFDIDVDELPKGAV